MSTPMFHRSVRGNRDVHRKGVKLKPFVSLLLVTVLLLACLAILIWRQVRQSTLNRQLVLAVKSLNVDQTRECLRAEAAPNLLDAVPALESPSQILARLWHHSPGKRNTMKGRPLLMSVLRHAWVSKDRQKCAQIALLLLKAGANADCPYDPLHDPHPRYFTMPGRPPRDKYSSPLTLAVYARLPQVVQALLDHGANANPEGLSPLYEASGFEDHSMALMLIAHGANPNYQDPPARYTPLMNAVGSDDVVLVRALLAKGANLSLKNFIGETAMSEARRAEEWDLVKLLSQQAVNQEKQKLSNAAKH